MNKSNLNYLTIGEVSKLKKISIKSLRYYDEIDVFKPSYTNPETGYRYYLVEQLPMLNIISFCTEVGISLKNWNQYLDEKNNFRLDKLLIDAKQLATKKLSMIQNGLNHIERTAQKMNKEDSNLLNDKQYIKFIHERHLLFIEVEREPNPKDFLVCVSKLFELVNDLNLDIASYYQAGVFMDFNQCEKKYAVFIEINEFLPMNPHYRHIDSGTYQCFRSDDIMIDSHIKIYPEYFEKVKSGTIIETDLINHTLLRSKSIIELQYLIGK